MISKIVIDNKILEYIGSADGGISDDDWADGVVVFVIL